MDESVAAGAPPVRLRAVPGSGGHLFSLLVVCFGVNGPRPVVVRSPGDIRQSTDAFRRRVRCGSRRAARSGSGRGVGRCASGPARVRQRGCLCTRWRLPASIGGATPRWSQFPGCPFAKERSGWAGGARSASSALAVRRRRVGAGPCVRRAWRLPASGGGATPRWSQFPGPFPQRKGVWG